MLLVPAADFSCNNNNSPVAYLREVCFRNNQLNKRMVCSEVPAVLEELVNNNSNNNKVKFLRLHTVLSYLFLMPQRSFQCRR